MPGPGKFVQRLREKLQRQTEEEKLGFSKEQAEFGTLQFLKRGKRRKKKKEGK